MVTMFTDLTERKMADAQLRLLVTCVARLNDIVVITEAEPRDGPGPGILFVNDAFIRRTGYADDSRAVDLRSLNLREVLSKPFSADTLLTAINGAISAPTDPAPATRPPQRASGLRTRLLRLFRFGCSTRARTFHRAEKLVVHAGGGDPWWSETLEYLREGTPALGMPLSTLASRHPPALPCAP